MVRRRPITRSSPRGVPRRVHAGPDGPRVVASAKPRQQGACAARGLLGAGVGSDGLFARAAFDRGHTVRDGGFPACGQRPLIRSELWLSEAAVCRGARWYRRTVGARNRVFVRTAHVPARPPVRRTAYRLDVGPAACRIVGHAHATNTGVVRAVRIALPTAHTRTPGPASSRLAARRHPGKTRAPASPELPSPVPCAAGGGVSDPPSLAAR